MINDTLDLSDLLAEGKKAQRQETIKKAAKKQAAERDKTPLPDGPPIRRDIYQQLDWKPLSLTLIVTHTHCDHCGHDSTAPNPYLLLERYHRRHGRHLVELSHFRLLPQAQITSLPRRIEERYTTTPFCNHCFLTGDALCLEPTMIPLQQHNPSAQSFSTGTPCVAQALASASLPQLWSDTFGATWGTTNDSSKS